MIEANSHGNLRVLRSFAPLMRPNERVFVVASSLGVLAKLPSELRKRLETTAGDPDAINAAVDAYVAEVEAGTAVRSGWPEWVNIPSKVGQVAVTRAFTRWAKRSGSLPEGVLVNAANPRVTLTDATRDFMGTVFKPDEAQTPEEAAAHPIMLATLPAGSVTPCGELVECMHVIPFGDSSMCRVVREMLNRSTESYHPSIRSLLAGIGRHWLEWFQVSNSKWSAFRNFRFMFRIPRVCSITS
jgi:NAD(P)-dependent dehydrogenase (short-subunit alcohol dehydrogenase family)